jgi:hypothetical protein
MKVPSPVGEGQGEGNELLPSIPLTPALSRRERGFYIVLIH